jgi:putative MATE family efflux protein
MKDLTQGPITRHILAMATPIAVGMLVQTLYYLVDLYFISQLGDVALAGASAASNVMFLVLALTQMLSVGTVACVSHAVGAGDRERASLVFNQAVTLAGLLAVGTLLAGYLGPAEFYVRSIGATEATKAAGMEYIYWTLPGMALHFASAAMGAALQGTGIVRPTMVVQMLTVLMNAILTPILVAGWGSGRPMGVAGAGLATTLAAGVGALLMAVYFTRLQRYVGFDAGSLAPRSEVLRRMLGIGIPAGGQFALMFVYMAVIYAVIRDFGAAAQAGFGVGVRVMQAVFLPAMAVAFSVPAIAGQNFGAGKPERVRETFRTATQMSVAFMGVLTLLCQWKPEWLVGSFSHDPEVLTVASVFLTFVSWNFAAAGITFTCSGMFQAMGNTLPALASTATRIVTFAVPAFWLSRQSGFRIVHVWYLSVATVWLQALLSLLLLRWQFGRRLPRLDPRQSPEAA